MATLLRDGIRDPELAAFPNGVGSVEQWVDSVDVLTIAARRRKALQTFRLPDNTVVGPAPCQAK